MLTSHARVMLTLLILIAAFSCRAADRPGRMVMVVAGNISIRDIADPRLPHLRMLFENGSSALLNVRTGRASKLIEPVLSPGMEPGCLSIGAGAMAAGGAEVRRAFDVHSVVDGSSAGAMYEFRTGKKPGLAEIVQTEIVRIELANASASYRAKPGALGEALRKAGVRTAVIGNSDIPGELHREAVAIAMDSAGLVDGGDVDSRALTLRDPKAPYGIRTDPDAVMREIDRVLPFRRFVVVDFGDTYRADTYCSLCTESRAIRVRRDAALRLDRFVALLSRRLDFRRDRLILVSPSSRTYSEIEEERLTPIVMRGPGFGGGLLISPSTRRSGVATICDVAPTVLAFFGEKTPAEMVGRAMRRVPARDAAAGLVALNLDACKQGERQVAMRGSGVAQSVVVVIVTVVLLLGAGRFRNLAAWMALTPAVIPLVMLYLPVFYSGGLAGAVALLVGLTVVLLIAAALVFRSPFRAFAWLCAAIVVTLLVDLVRGVPLISSAIAGYSLVEGARYYGIGNELMGTLIGATIIGAGVCVPRAKGGNRVAEVLVPIVFALVFVVMALPMLGAELGGSGAMAAAAAVALLARRGWKLSVRNVLLVAALGVVGLGAAFALDAMRGGGAQSHVGRAADLLTGGDPAALLQVAQRKLALNFMLVSTSVWSRLLGLSMLGSALLYWWKVRANPIALLTCEERSALAGCVVASACAFALNDSGVLAAAACAVFGWILLALKAATR